MDLKYKSWKDININTFDKLKNITLSDDKSDLVGLNTNIELLSILCDCDEDDIANLTTSEFSYLLSQTEYLKEMPKVDINDTYILNGTEYKVFLTLKEMSVAQYIDFQTFFKEKEKYLKELLSIFLIPKGKKYGEGYSIDDTIKEIGEHLSIVEAKSILFFFIILYQSLTKVTLDCSIKDLKKVMKKTKNEDEKEKLNMAIMEMEKAKASVKNGLGFTL